MLTDTISTVGWWLMDNVHGSRFAQPFTAPEYISQLGVGPDLTINASLGTTRIVGYTNDPEAVLAWVREGKLP